MSAADDAAPVSAAEAKTLFDPLADASALVLAVSGGPDSTALLLLAARWRRARKTGPRLLAVTIDHGLRRESAERGARRSAFGAPARRAPSHRALERQEAGDRIAAERARGALSAACRGRRAGEGAHHRHRTYPRRPGRDRAHPHESRQRPQRAWRHGARGASAGRWRRRAGAAAARDSESAPHRHARSRRHRIRRRPVEPRPALHPRAPARGDVRARPRGARRAPAVVAGAAATARGGRDRDSGRCRDGGAVASCRGRIAGRSCSMPTNSIACPRRSPCGCSAARSLAPATRDRSSSASSRHSTRRCERARAPARPSRWRRTLAGALVTLRGTKLAIERAPARRGRAASGAARAV